MALQYQLNNGSFAKHFCILALVAIIGFFWLASNLAGEVSAESNPILNGIGALFLLFAFLYPVYLVGDVADKIPAIAAYNKTAKEKGKNKIKVNHPKTTLVWVLFVLGFFTFGLLWLVALMIASGVHNVTIPDDLALELGMKEVGRDSASTNAQELASLKKLLDEGVLTKKEFQKRKKELGF